jgi:hypothetical protein
MEPDIFSEAPVPPFWVLLPLRARVVRLSIGSEQESPQSRPQSTVGLTLFDEKAMHLNHQDGANIRQLVPVGEQFDDVAGTIAQVANSGCGHDPERVGIEPVVVITLHGGYSEDR